MEEIPYINTLEIFERRNIPIRFKYYDPNPLGKIKHIPGLTDKDHRINKRWDCSTRAMTLATRKDYREIFEEQLKLSLECFDMPNAFNIINTIMHENGFEVYELSQTASLYLLIMKYTEGTTLYMSKDHAVTVIDGCIYDKINMQSERAFSKALDYLLYMQVKVFFRKV